jgi:hypothetical protein
VGRNVVSLLAGDADAERCLVAYSASRALPPHRLLASDAAAPLHLPGLSDGGQVA